MVLAPVDQGPEVRVPGGGVAVLNVPPGRIDQLGQTALGQYAIPLGLRSVAGNHAGPIVTRWPVRETAVENVEDIPLLVRVADVEHRYGLHVQDAAELLQIARLGHEIPLLDETVLVDVGGLEGIGFARIPFEDRAVM